MSSLAGYIFGAFFAGVFIGLLVRGRWAETGATALVGGVFLVMLWYTPVDPTLMLLSWSSLPTILLPALAALSAYCGTLVIHHEMGSDPPLAKPPESTNTDEHPTDSG